MMAEVLFALPVIDSMRLCVYSCVFFVLGGQDVAVIILQDPSTIDVLRRAGLVYTIGGGPDSRRLHKSQQFCNSSISSPLIIAAAFHDTCPHSLCARL